jgi:hydroxyacyl-ACP dehydratase HTD2-like protein with hotdog domain
MSELPAAGNASTTAGALPAGVQAVIGRRSKHVYEVTCKDIRRYAQAIGDSRFESSMDMQPSDVVAPPLFCHTLAFEDVPPARLRADGRPSELDIPLPCQRTVGGGSTFDYYAPIRPGDVITVEKVIEDIYRKRGRSGDLYFVVLSTKFTNQDSVLVARERATFVNR